MSSPRRRTGPRLVGIVVLVALLGTACGVRPESEARPLRPEDIPAGVLGVPTASPQPAGTRAQRLLFIRDGRLVPVRRPAVQVTPQTALADLLSGPLPAERQRGLTTALPVGAGPGQVSVEAGIATVSLTGELLASGRSDQVLALAQVVATLDGLRGVSGVRFLADGEPLPVPRGDGALVETPLTAADYPELLAPRPTPDAP